MTNRTALLIAGLIAGTAGTAHAVPEQLGLTARLSDNGAPVTGAHTFAIRVFAAPTGGTPLWTESDAATATDGLVYLTLGDQAPLDAAVLDGGPLWVELQVDSTVLAPRLAVTSAAYAVRAGIAEDAERLGGQPATAFAAAGHAHAGTYLPVGTALACAGTDKVRAITVDGSVVCGPDTDAMYTAGPGMLLTGTQLAVAFAGSGASPTAARSDHTHAGSYLPVGATLTCPGTQKVTGLGANGSVVCGPDVDTDTNTTYAAGNGLSLIGTQFSVQFGGSGAGVQAARSDHNHATTICPLGYTSFVSGTATICVRPTGQIVNWVTATRACLSFSGGSLCSVEQITQVRALAPGFSMANAYWLADRMGDNLAVHTNASGSTDDFDAVGTVTDLKSGYYCCLERRWW